MTLSLSTERTKPEPTPPAAQLPPLGPAWYPAVMGTAILGTLLQTQATDLPGAHLVALPVLGLCWALLVLLTAGFLWRIARSRTALTATLVDPNQMAMWGTVSMGILAVGSCTLTVLPAWWPSAIGLAWRVDLVLWLAGTLIGVAAALGFGVRLVGSDCGAPTTVWGLAVVGPMVSATTGAALVPHVGAYAGIWLLVGTVACFFLSFFVGTVVFAVAYHHHWRIAAVPLAASCSAWIPLGMVGQSSAAAQAMTTQASRLVDPTTSHAIGQIANTYGYCTLAVGVPLVAWAVLVTVRGVRGRMPFAPGWWALTFPIGTLSLGAHLLGRATGESYLSAIGLGATLVLCCTVTLCLVASLRAVRRRGIAW